MMPRAAFRWLRSPVARGALGVVWLCSFAISWFSALPLALVVRTAARRLPSGDAVLFSDGGTLLLELITQESDALGAGLGASLSLLLLALPVWLFSSAVLFRALGSCFEPDASLPAVLASAFLLVPHFCALWLLARAAQLILLALFVLAASIAARILAPWLSERAADVVVASAALLGLFACLVVQLLFTLAASLVAPGRALVASLLSALGELRPRLLRPFVAWCALELAGLLLVVLGAIATSWIATSAHWAFEAALHQLALLGNLTCHSAAVALVANWMSVGRDDLVELGIASGSTLPAEVEPHDAAP